MTGSALPRTSVFAGEPVGELRGLATLTDPDDVSAVIDLAVIGARGDGKTQFIVHAIRAMHAHAPALAGAEQTLNRDVLRLVLDPRSTRPDATPPGVVPHFTFRVRTPGLLDRLSWRGAIRLACRATGIATALAMSLVLLIVAAVVGVKLGPAPAVVVGGSAALLAGSAALIARRRIAQTGDIEVAFWDVAGEQVYSSSAADYYNLLAHLVEARRRRAEELGRSYSFAPILICNPLALGTADEGSPYERMRQLLPLFAALDERSARAMIAINRWAVVDPICARGALRDEVVAVSSSGRGETPAPARQVAREQVRAHCLDAEDTRDQDVRLTYLRYDTAIKTSVEVDGDAATIEYAYDDGPGAFSGEEGTHFLDWVVGLVHWDAHRTPATTIAPSAAPSGSIPTPQPPTPVPPRSLPPVVGSPVNRTALQTAIGTAPPVDVVPDPEIWARPQDLPGTRS